MEKRRRVGGEGANRGMEENTMAILDTFAFSSTKSSHHLNDDRLAYMEAVRIASLLPDNGSPPTPKMLEAILNILKDADSLDLIVESYQLLIELDKRFPRVYLSKGEQSVSSSPANVLSQLVLVEEAWIPFNLAPDSYSDKEEAANYSRSSVDSLGFYSLVQEIAQATEKADSKAVEMMFLKKMLLLQYLIIILERDFVPRNIAYQENVDWTLLRESILNMLLSSRKTNYKVLIKDCLLLMCDLSQLLVLEEASHHENSSWELPDETNSAEVLLLPDVKKSTCTALKKFFVLAMELDSSRKVADCKGLTTRADGVRTPVLEIILDELIYNKNLLCPFLQVIDPKWKLQISVQYFQKYIPKPTVQTRRTTEVINTENFDGILKCLLNRNSAKNIIKKISSEIVQLLLAYGLQAYLALSNQHSSEGAVSDTVDDIKSYSTEDVCKNFISAFTCLGQEDQRTQISPFGKEALVAAAVISSKSEEV